MGLQAKILWLWLLWFLALGLFLLGVLSPIMTIEQFYLFEDQFSVLTALNLLFDDGQAGLALLIGCFSLLLPLLKLLVLARAIREYAESGQVTGTLLHWIHRYGRWSMLDVFVIAVLIVGFKLSAFASIQLHLGLWAFAGGLLLMLVLTSVLQRLRQTSETAH